MVPTRPGRIWKEWLALLTAGLLLLASACNLPAPGGIAGEQAQPAAVSPAVPTLPAGTVQVSTPFPTGTAAPSSEDFSLAALYQDASQYKYIFPGYSMGTDSGAPWGFEHLGLDMLIATSGAAVLAPADGVVENLVTYCNPRNNQWQVNLLVRYNSSITYNILFEPRAPSESEVAQQWDALPLTIGQPVRQGDLLGAMLDLSHGDRSGGEPGLHFDLWIDGDIVCPEPYFQPQAHAGMLALVQAKFPGAKLCYP